MTAPRAHPTPQRQVQGLRDAADLIIGCAELGLDMHDDRGRVLARVSQPFALPIAHTLRASAELIERHGHSLGLPVSFDLELAGLVLGVDLGHNR